MSEKIKIYSASEHKPSAGFDLPCKYYGYIYVDHPELGKFYVSSGVSNYGKDDIRVDGKPWEFLRKKKYRLTQEQKDWVLANKDKLETLRGGDLEIDMDNYIKEGLEEDFEKDQKLINTYKQILKIAAGKYAISDTKLDHNIGDYYINIEPSDEAINAAQENLESIGFKEVDHYFDESTTAFASDSYIVFTREDNGERIVVGIIFNPHEDFAYITCGYDEIEDSDYFIIESKDANDIRTSSLNESLGNPTKEEIIDILVKECSFDQDEAKEIVDTNSYRVYEEISDIWKHYEEIISDPREFIEYDKVADYIYDKVYNDFEDIKREEAENTLNFDDYESEEDYEAAVDEYVEDSFMGEFNTFMEEEVDLFVENGSYEDLYQFIDFDKFKDEMSDNLYDTSIGFIEVL